MASFEPLVLLRQCDHCGVLFSPRDRLNVYCGVQCNQAAWWRRHSSAPPAGSCVVCGDKIQRRTRGPVPRFCSNRCRHRSHYVANASSYMAHSRMRRAIKRTRSVERIVAIDVFERDGWVCGICDMPVDCAAAYPDPGSASLDHIVPLSKGGTHTWENVRCSHLRCNLVRGNRIEAALCSPT